ncbi:uncharacterized protein LOC106780090 [Vigna radiata var. radiata]|uniref:Uncharacterized protein LOC106780090 n=1 Tax=Vigna radiata var. radiata TaxID=3916 RepID=A0A1S3W0L0_VIGRR|nr:uncharacterized protein LOC106780090 [Vigna radiata var. radiata]
MEETLGQAWDRYKSLLRKMPTHGFDDTSVVLSFLGGLSIQTKLLLDAAARGNIKNKIAEEAYELINNMATNDITTKLKETLQQFMQATISNQKSTEASIRNLEIQGGQLAKNLEDMPDRGFGANTKVIPKEECNAIMTRSEKQYGRFMEIFKQLEITMPLTEALRQVYAKHMKQFLKKKYLDEQTIKVQGNCSAILQKTLPLKFKDPGSFTIPCIIGNYDIGKALVDLRASINLMPLSMLKKIGGMAVKPTKAILQMVYRSIKLPYGVIEDVVMRIDKLKFPVDFVVMKMEENEEIPIILG